MKHKSLKIIPIIIIGILTILLLFSQVFFLSSVNSSTQLSITYDIVGSPIEINDLDPQHSWSKTRDDFPWCTGAGTSSNPYVIQNLYMDGQGSVECLSISNSEVFFLIINCEFKNAGGDFGIGITLFNVKNGNVYNNFIHDNDWIGLHCMNSEKLNIEQNTIRRQIYGIVVEQSNIVELLDNTIGDHSREGIGVVGSSNCLISQNDISSSSINGIYMDYTDDSTVSHNSISGSEDGLRFSHSSNNEITNNVISDSSQYGIIAFYESNYNSITDNILTNNLYCIGIGESCVGNIIERNGICQLYIVHDTSDPPPPDNPDTPPPSDLDLGMLGLWLTLFLVIGVLAYIKMRKS